uniref:Uncharacterized protein n=1 Tax=Setaria italica TaxID=4555 RepID=K4A434_SETIT
MCRRHNKFLTDATGQAQHLIYREPGLQHSTSDHTQIVLINSLTRPKHITQQGPFELRHYAERKTHAN